MRGSTGWAPVPRVQKERSPSGAKRRCVDGLQGSKSDTYAHGAGRVRFRCTPESLEAHMTRLLLTVTFTAMLASPAEAQPVSDPRIADLVQAGKIRVGMHSIMYTKDSQTGELKAASTGIILLDVARALAARMEVAVLPVGHPTIPEMLTCLTAGACDVGFMGPDRSRAGVDYSPPILQLEYTLLVPAGSSIQRIADADRPGVRIAVVRDHASTLTLSRMVKHAELTYAATPDPTFEFLRTGQADAFASVRPVLWRMPQSFPARGCWRTTTGPTSSAWRC